MTVGFTFKHNVITGLNLKSLGGFLSRLDQVNEVTQAWELNDPASSRASDLFSLCPCESELSEMMSLLSLSSRKRFPAIGGY